MWVSHYIFVACLNYSAERQVLRVRKEFFSAVLRQDLAWYDTATTAEFATRMTEDLNKLQVMKSYSRTEFLRLCVSKLFIVYTNKL